MSLLVNSVARISKLFRVNTDMDLAPDPTCGAAMLAGVRFPFALDLDAGAVHQQVQGAVRATVGDIHLQGLLAPRQGAEVWDGPVQAEQAQQALDEPSGLPKRHPEQHRQRQASLDRGITASRLTPALAGRRGIPSHRGTTQIVSGRGASALRYRQGQLRVLQVGGADRLIPPSGHPEFTR